MRQTGIDPVGSARAGLEARLSQALVPTAQPALVPLCAVTALAPPPESIDRLAAPLATRLRPVRPSGRHRSVLVGLPRAPQDTPAADAAAPGGHGAEPDAGRPFCATGGHARTLEDSPATPDQGSTEPAAGAGGDGGNVEQTPAPPSPAPVGATAPVGQPSSAYRPETPLPSPSRATRRGSVAATG